MSRRYDDWAARLDAITIDYQKRKFRWGKSDCGTLATDCVRALTGIDLYQDFSGQYDSLRSYARLLSKYNCQNIGDLFSVMANQFGFKSIPLKLAKRGDIITVISCDMECLGVCQGRHSMFHMEQGLLMFETLQCERAWSID